MITKEQILDYCLETPGAMYDKPFSDDFETTVLRHKDTKKWFGIYQNSRKIRNYFNP